MNGRRRHPEVGPHVGLGRRAAVQLRVEMNEAEILALNMGERANDSTRVCQGAG